MILDLIEKVDLHRQRAKKAMSEIKVFQENLQTDIFEDFENVKTIDTFIYRFIKVHVNTKSIYF
jgi:hypothetical protein